VYSVACNLRYATASDHVGKSALLLVVLLACISIFAYRHGLNLFWAPLKRVLLL
jgi:hypothetical protein